jgi:hypothetical protein
MKIPHSATVAGSVATVWPSEHLRGAALAGLLCLATVACSPKQNAEGTAGAPGAAGEQGVAGAEAAGASGGSAAQTGGSAPSAGGAGDAAGGVPTAAGGVSDMPEAGTGGAAAMGGAAGSGGAAGVAGAAGTAGAGGAAPEPPHITSSENVGVLTEEQFKALCDARAGVVEVMPHCGGFATAKGFSYDNGTQLLSEHTCAAANTCGGWNCVLTDE